MNWRRLGVALMLVGLAVGATGTYSAVSLDADRGFSIGAAGDDPDQQNANYFDTADRTASYTTIGDWPKTVLAVFNQFGQPVTATEVAVVDLQPVNASANNTTTNRSALSVADSAFSKGSTLGAGNDAPVAIECNPDYNNTVRGDHEIGLSLVVVGDDSGAEIALDRTVTATVECN
ncbi:hypothetical protein JCM30237_09610 [Halolamina litorea]|uniref:SipW-cognate class signal peptide n=1 Tax=Halolamina litorea TaxID=1515593 RepID=A0ABD6BW74_9EURY|nr:hypothetical protein [Halolamina litorea]